MEDVHTDSAAPVAAPMAPAAKKGMSGGLIVILAVLLLIIIGAWAYAMHKDDSAVTGEDMTAGEQMPADDSSAAGTMETGSGDVMFDSSAGVEVQ